MADERSSGFFFDVKAWRGSRSVQRMSMAERGVYLEMMCEQWEKRFLPDDAAAVADLIAATQDQVEEVLSSWPIVRRKFVTPENGQRRIYNAALERTRRQQRENRRNRQLAGSKGGKAKALKRTKQTELEAGNATAMLESALAKPSDKTRLDMTRQDTPRGPRLFGGEHAAHAHCGRVCVPAFLHRQLRSSLGGNEQAADDRLRAWYSEVERELPDGEAVPADVLKFWRARFDGTFTTPATPAAAKSGPITPKADETAALLRELKAGVQ